MSWAAAKLAEDILGAVRYLADAEFITSETCL